MSKLKNLFNLHNSFIEIESWVIIDFNPETGSITEYEDYELSAESFLVEPNTVSTLPSMKMPLPETSSATEKYDATVPQDKALEKAGRNKEREKSNDGKVSSSCRRAQNGTEKDIVWNTNENNDGSEHLGDGRSLSEDERAESIKKRERVWAEITRNLTASLESDDGPITPEAAEAKGESERSESEGSELDDSLHGEGSGSGHTDPDFLRYSSDDTDVEWILGSGMVGSKVCDSLSLIQRERVESWKGEIHRYDGEEEEVEDAGGPEDEMEEEDEEVGKVTVFEECVDKKENNEHSGGVGEKLEEHQREGTEHDVMRRGLRNVSLAASVTAVVVAAIWILERRTA